MNSFLCYQFIILGTERIQHLSPHSFKLNSFSTNHLLLLLALSVDVLSLLNDSETKAAVRKYKKGMKTLFYPAPSAGTGSPRQSTRI